MIIIRIILLIFFILSGIISTASGFVFIPFVSLFGFIMTIIWVLIRDYNIDIDSYILEKRKEKIKANLEIEKIRKEYPKKAEAKEYNEPQKYNGIEVDSGKLIIFLLIVIIVILLWTNGIFYKLTIVNKDNIDDILASSYLSESEKTRITFKLVFNNENEVYGKMIWQLLQ